MLSTHRTTLFALAITLWASIGYADEEESVLHARLWVGAMTPERIAYEAAAIALALEKSQTHAGDYRLTLISEDRSDERVIRELREGKIINMASAPVWPINLEPDPPMDIVPIPIAKGLVGYRRLVVRNEDLETFNALSSLDELREYSAGFGRNWSDLAVFHNAELPVVEGSSIQQLYSMLARERFDYFPLSPMAVEGSLAASGYADQLTIVPNLIIYYPLPIHVQISINQPELRRRVEEGLKAATADGSLERLFDEHFQGLVGRLRQLNPKIMMLENPNIAEPGPLSEPQFLPNSPLIH
jgi:hypothetical protein